MNNSLEVVGGDTNGKL